MKSIRSARSDAEAGRAGPPLIAMLSTQILSATLVAAAFIGLYVGLQREPEPHNLPVAIADPSLARAAVDAWGDKAIVIAVDDAPAARRAVEHHQAVAAIAPTEGTPGGIEAYTAGADGRSAVSAATGMITGFAQAAGLTVVGSTDLVPLVMYDALGLAGFYVVFGITLASFILGQIMFGLGPRVSVRTRAVTMAAFALVGATVGSIIAGPVFGSIPTPLYALVPTLALLSASVSLTTFAVARLLGPLGIVLATIGFTTLGNATSGATLSAFLLPPVVAMVGSAMPPGAAYRALVDFGYFEGRDAAVPLLTLAVWVAVALLAVGLSVVAARRRPTP